MHRLIRIAKENLPLYARQILEIETTSFASPWSIYDFKTEMKKPITHLWALTSGNRLIGYICFWFFWPEIHITNFAIHPAERGKQLGEFILKRMIKAGIRKRLNSIRLEVRPSNIIARNLYSKLGFHETGRSYQYYKETGEDAIIMVLELSKKEI